MCIPRLKERLGKLVAKHLGNITGLAASIPVGDIRLRANAKKMQAK